MSDSISRLGIVVEEKGLEKILTGLDKLIMLMQKADSAASSPITPQVDTKNVESAAAKITKSNKDIEKSEKELASTTASTQSSIAESKVKSAAIGVSAAESSAKKETDIAEKLKAATTKIEADASAKKVSNTVKTEADTTSVVEAASSKRVASTEKSIAKILALEASAALEKQKSLTAIETASAKNSTLEAATALKKQEALTNYAKSSGIALEASAKAASSVEQINAKSEGQIKVIQANVAAYADKLESQSKLSAQRNKEFIDRASEESLSKTKLATSREEAEKAVIIARGQEQRALSAKVTADRISVIEAKTASSIEQANARSNAQIQTIRERTASFAEKMGLREQAANERTLKAQQQGVDSLSSLASKASAIMSIGFAGWGIQESIMGLIKAADSMTELNARLRLVTTSSSELKVVQQSLFEMSQKSGTSIKANSEIYFGLARASKTLGTSQSDLIRLTDGLSKASIVGGSSAESYKSAMTQLRQGLESGVLRGQELNSVMEQAPRVAQALAEGLGKTTGELRKMGAEGGLVTEVVIPALLTGFKKIDKEFESMPNTFGRGWQKIENSFLSWIQKANDAKGVTTVLSEAMSSLSVAMDSVSANGIATTLGYAAVAANGLALVFSGKLIGAIGNYITSQYDSIMANAAKANSDLASAKASVVVTEQNVIAAKSAQERAAIVVAAAERELIAANTGITSAERLIAAQEASAIAARNLAASQTALSIAKEGATVATNSLAVAEERQAAAATLGGVAMSGLKSVFSALGGWITVAIGSIYLLVRAWDRVANAAVNARDAQKSATSSASSATTITEARRIGSKATEDIKNYSREATRLEIASGNEELSKSTREGAAKEAAEYREAIENARQAQAAAVKREKDIRDNEKSAREEAANAVSTPDKVVKKFSENPLVQTSDMSKASEIAKVNQARQSAILSVRASVPQDEKFVRYSEKPDVKSAEDKINNLADAKIAEINKKDKKAGGAKAKRPELSAGYEAVVAGGKEELELLTKLGSAQEKLLGYVVPETLARKQAVEVSQEQFNVQAKMAKIQEQLKKTNLGDGVRESLEKTLAMYKKRTDFISEELAVTHALQKEQNNIKIYQEDILKPAQRRAEIDKELLSYAVQTGEISSAEANRQTLINSQKMIEVEYAGQLEQAEKTYNDLQAAGYSEAAKNAQKRLSTLTAEKDAKVKISQIKLDGEADAKKFEAGFGRAWQKYKDDAADASKLTEKLMGGVLKGIEDALYNMMSGVKVSFSDLFKSILSDVKRYLAQQMTKEIGDGINGMLNSIIKAGSGTGGGTGSGTGGAGGSSTNGGTGGTTGGIFTTIGTLGKDAYNWITGSGSKSVTEMTAAESAAAEIDTLGPVNGGVGSTIGTYATYAKIAFDVFNSFKTGEGWGTSAGGVAGAVVGSIIPGLGTALGSAIGSTLGSFLDSAFGGGGGENVGGNFVTSWDASGKVISQEHGAGFTNNQKDKDVQTAVDAMYTQYADLVKALGGTTKGLDFSLGYRTDPEGTSGNTIRSQVNVNGVENAYSTYHQINGDVAAEMKLESSKMIVAALKGSELKKEVEDIFNSIDITTATQAQLDGLIEQAKTATQVSDKAAEDAKIAASNLEAEMKNIFALFKGWSTVFPQFEKASGDAKKAFVDLAGGIDSLASKMSSYYSNFYSSTEKTANVWSNITSVLSNAGVKEIPRTRAEFRKLMDSTDITTESGKKLASALLSIESQFASVTDSLDDVTKAAEANNKAEIDAKKIADDTAKANKAAAIRDAESAVETARSKVQTAYDREAGSLKTLIDRLTQFRDQIGKLKDSLKLDNNLSPLSNYDKYQFSKTRLEEIQQKALDGDEKAQGELEQASLDFLNYSRTYNANNSQYKLDFDAVQGYLTKVSTNTKVQIDNAKIQLEKLDKMVAGIIDVNDSVQTLEQAVTKYLEALVALGNAKSAPDPVTPPVVTKPPPTVPPTTGGTSGGTGGGTSPSTGGASSGGGSTADYVNSIASAELTGLINNVASIVYHRGATQGEIDSVVQNLGMNATWDSIMSAALAARDGGLSAHDAFVGRVNAVSNVMQHRDATSSEIDWVISKVGEGASFTAIKAAAASGLGITLTHANGLASVPYDGYRAELHQGERVLTKNEASEYNSGSNNWSSSVVAPLLAELSTLREEVKALRQEVSTQGDADRQQRGLIAETQIGVQKRQAVEASRAYVNNL